MPGISQFTLHYTTLQNTTLHYTTIHYATLHYTSLHYTTPNYTILPHTTQHYTIPYILHNTISNYKKKTVHKTLQTLFILYTENITLSLHIKVIINLVLSVLFENTLILMTKPTS